MSFIEFIGFIISMVAMIILFFRRTIEKRRRDRDPQYYEKLEQQKEVKLKEFLRALDVQYEEKGPEDEEDDDDDEDEDEDEELYLPQKKTAPPQTRLQQQMISQNTPVHASEDHFQFRSDLKQMNDQTKTQKRLQPTAIGDSYKNRYDEKATVNSLGVIKTSDDPYALKGDADQNRIFHILRHLDSMQDMIILNEVIGPPKSLR